jgi:hypothetical protein
VIAADLEAGEHRDREQRAGATIGISRNAAKSMA